MNAMQDLEQQAGVALTHSASPFPVPERLYAWGSCVLS